SGYRSARRFCLLHAARGFPTPRECRHQATAAATAASPTLAPRSLGSLTVNREPLPGVLSTSTLPPITWQNRDTIASPRPVPPYLRVVVTSAWVNGSNTFAACSAVMPTPVSETTNSTKPCV